jgi:hemoglobin-like flavoprotein
LAPESVTREQGWLVQSSWEKVVPMAPHVAELFFDRLFELDPFLEDLFPSDLSKLGAEWMRALGLAALQLTERGLDEPSSLAPCIEGLSRMHVEIGVRPGHYVTMGNALLWTLEQSLAEDFTPRVKDAWSAAYQVLSALLIQADAAAVLGSVVRASEPGSAADAGTPRGARRPVDAVPRDGVPVAARRAV